MSANNENIKKFKLIYINDGGRCRIVRHYLKPRIENTNENLSFDMEEEYQDRLPEVENMKDLADLNRDMLQQLKNKRKHTESVAQDTLSRCKLLLQKMEQPVTHAEELHSTEQSMRNLLQELKK